MRRYFDIILQIYFNITYHFANRWRDRQLIVCLFTKYLFYQIYYHNNILFFISMQIRGRLPLPISQGYTTQATYRFTLFLWSCSSKSNWFIISGERRCLWVFDFHVYALHISLSLPPARHSHFLQACIILSHDASGLYAFTTGPELFLCFTDVALLPLAILTLLPFDSLYKPSLPELSSPRK